MGLCLQVCSGSPFCKKGSSVGLLSFGLSYCWYKLKMMKIDIDDIIVDTITTRAYAGLRLLNLEQYILMKYVFSFSS
jgi:hypothetical protein